jgi:hypothetical protein
MARKKSARPRQVAQPVLPAAYTPANQPESPEAPKLIGRLRKAILACLELTEKERVAAFNAATGALRSLVADLCDDPVLALKLVPAEDVSANDYNPNRVATPEMDLLEQSIRCDGVTMPIVTYRDIGNGKRIVVDGFHRRCVLTDRLHRRYLPVTEIDKPLAERMASTIRHNRARGKHQVDLMAALVKSLMAQGWDDPRIAEHIGMTEEELLRLKQVAGVARLLAADEYSQSWGLTEGEDGTEDHPV